MEDSKKEYKRLIFIISKARIAGIIGWEDINGRKQLHAGDASYN